MADVASGSIVDAGGLRWPAELDPAIAATGSRRSQAAAERSAARDML